MPKEKSSQENIKNFLSEIPFYVVSNKGRYEYRWKGPVKNRYIEENITSGGLATALNSVMEETGSTWITWASGTKDAEKEYMKKNEIKGRKNTIKVPRNHPKYYSQKVFLSDVDVSKYYHGFSNRVLWPLFHEIDVPPAFHRTDYWQSYKKVNKKFAENIPNGKKQLLWIHDYHLALVPKILREKDLESVVTFFWHIPWPSTDRYIRCPWRTEIVEGLISSDIIGFHLDDYIENFLESVEVCTDNDVKVNHDNGKITQGKKTTIVKSYPIGVDFKKFEQMANNPTLNPDELHTGKILMLGVERLDYTKGLIEKLRGIETFFEKHKEEYKGNIQFVQIASPSRQKVKEYRDITKEVKKITERINTNFRIGKWKPIELINEDIKQNILADYYRRADAFLVLPHHDGMNLTAKEFVASQVEKKGVLILSQFAGAARELGKYSILVNPFNRDEVVDAIHKAAIMSKREKGEKMEKMRKHVRANDVHKWVREIMDDAITLYKK